MLEQEVDAVRYLRVMRTARVDMVEKLEQYIFSHHVLIDTLETDA
jgi:hypothetical protein